MVGLVSVHEDWTALQRVIGHNKPLPDKLWRSKFPVTYGLIGFDIPSEGQRAHNRETVKHLLNPRLLPFLHAVENVSY